MHAQGFVEENVKSRGDKKILKVKAQLICKLKIAGKIVRSI